MKKPRIRKTKYDLVRIVSEDTGINSYTVDRVIKSTIDNIMLEVSQGNEVYIKGFGLFEPKERAARLGRNPHDGSPVPIPARVIPSFEPAQRFKQVATKNLK